MIIDCHCHAGSGDGFTGPWDTRAPLEDYMRRATAAGIQRSVLFAAFHSDYAVANKEVAKIVASQPDRFYGFAFVHAVRDRGRVHQLIETAVRQYGFAGIKVHRHDAPITREICDEARAFALPVLYDVVGEVSVCELLAKNIRMSTSSFPISAALPTIGVHNWASLIIWFVIRISIRILPVYGVSICWSKR